VSALLEREPNPSGSPSRRGKGEPVEGTGLNSPFSSQGRGAGRVRSKKSPYLRAMEAGPGNETRTKMLYLGREIF